MKKVLYLLVFTLSTLVGSGQLATPVVQLDQQTTDSITIRSLFDEALVNGESYRNLRYLCKVIGHRLSGSSAASEAVDWAKEELEKIGLDRTYLQPIEVPFWTRGTKEWAAISEEVDVPIDICALGGSVGTDGPLLAEVVQVSEFSDLAKLGREQIEGKIVFFNKPMDKRLISTFDAYGGCVGQRYAGASQAAKFGAVAVMIRSLTTLTDEHPHTGSMGYESGVTKIPACAVSTKDADILSEYLKANGSVEVVMNMDCQDNGTVRSYNVIGEITGTEKPNEVIVIGAHLDSWDKGEGAHDDGAGVVQCMEVLRLFKALNIKPRHTIRVVLYMNEENGNNGGKAYARKAAESNEKHVAALESDRGGFSPRGFSINGSNAQLELIRSYSELLKPYNLHFFEPGYAGVDISPLKKVANPNILLIGLVPDPQRYFDYHHSHADVFEVVNQRELELGGASMAALVYLLDQSLSIRP
jgi:hypothetical protein